MTEPVRHARLRAQLKAFADRELAPFERLRVAHHVRVCPACREEFQQMQTLSNELRESESQTPDAPLSDELRAHILQQAPDESAPAFDELARRRRRVARKKTVLALGAVSLASLIGFSSLQNQTGAPGRDSVASESQTDTSSAPSPNAGVVVGGASSAAPNSDFKSSENERESGAKAASGSGASTFSAPIDGAARATLRNEQFSDGHQKSTANGQRFAANPITRRGIAGDSASAASGANYADSLSSVVPPSRAVHREGSLSVAVQNAEEASDNATRIIKNAGGFIAQTSLDTGAGQKRTATLDCRVPVEQFETVVQKIGGLGSVRAKSLSGQDITAQVAQSGARRQSLSQELSIAQARLAKIEGAKKPDQGAVYASRADVRALRLQASQARAALETLQKYGSLSSLYVSLQDGVPFIAPKTTGWTDSLSPTTRATWNSFLSNARLPIQLALWLLAYSPIWLPALLVWRKYGRKWLAE